MNRPTFGKYSQNALGLLVGFGLFAFVGFPTLKAQQHPVPTNLPAGFPSWWFSQGVILPSNPTNTSPSWPASYPTSDDYSIANQGQLKNIAAAANTHLRAYLPSAVLSNSNVIALQTLVSGWTTNPSTNADSYAVLNQGQLKFLAQQFYTVLGSASYTAGLGLPPAGWTNGASPWTSSTNAADAYSAANIGQIKYLFSFDLSAPAGQVPLWWLQYYLGTTNASPTNLTPAGNGLTLLQAYLAGANPSNYYSQGSNPIIPVLSIVSGNNQNSLAGVTFSGPLTIQVGTTNGVLTNAPVSFTVSSGSGLLTTNTSGSPTYSSTLSLRTGANGQAQVSLQDATVGTDTITATAGTGSPVFFTETILPTPVQFSIPSGSYYSSQTETLTSSTAGATIYYTTNGSTPTTNSTAYNGAIALNSSTTINAIAVQNGLQSAVSSVSVNISNPMLTIVSASNLALNSGEAGVLVLQVSDTNNNPLFNVPVGFSASSPGLIGTSTNGSYSSTLQINSDTNGKIQLYVQMSTPATNFTVVATAGPTNSPTQASFTISSKINPTSLSGLGLWFKADNGVASSSGKVTAWTNLTTNFTLTQSTSANQPLLTNTVISGTSMPVVRFSGANQWLSISTNATNYASLNADMTMIVVGASTNTAPQQYSMYLGPGGSTGVSRAIGNYQSRQLLDTYSAYAQGIAVPNAGTMTAEAWTLNSNRTSASFYRNGLQVGTGSLSGVQNLGNGIELGAIPYASGYGWQGDIAEVLVYNHQLSTNEMAQLNQYFGDKYGMYTPSATWPSSYPAAVQALIARNGWNKLQATNYVTQLAANPTPSATGLALWFKADSGVTVGGTNGTNVTGWSDPIRGTTVTQATTNNQPALITNVLNGLPVVRFNGSGSLYNSDNATNYENLNNDMTMIVVGASTNTSPQQYSMYLGPGGTGQNRGIGYYLGRELMDTYNVYGQGISVPSAKTFFVEGWTLNSTRTNIAFFRNGLQVTNTAPNGTIGSLSYGITLGSIPYTSGCGWQGDIAEVLVYDHQLSTNEMAQVHQYLGDKYGLYTPSATWIQSYPTAVQTQILNHGWNKTQAANYSAATAANPSVPATGLSMWFKADAGVTTNGTNGSVSTWVDQLGNYSVTQSTSNNMPSYVTNDLGGKPALRFNGSQFLANSTQVDNGFNSGMTMVTVVSSTNPTLQQYSFFLGGPSTGTGRGLGYLYSSQDFSFYGIDKFGTNIPLANTFTIESASIDSGLANIAFYRNGFPAGTNTVTSVQNIAAGLNIGTVQNRTDIAWKGDIAEVLVYDHQLSTNEIAQVHQYLGDKYGMYTPSATWIQNYTTAVQGQIIKHNWNKAQADNYVAQLGANPGLLGTGLALWFKADSGVALSGTNVTGWTDPIGGESVTQSATNNQPSYATNVINGYPTVRFNSGSQWLYNSANATNYGNLNADMTMIVVGASTNTAASQYGMFLGVGGMSSYGGQGRGLAYAGSTQFMDAAYDSVVGAGVPAVKTFNAEAWTLNAAKTNVTFYRNGTQTASTTIGGVGNLSVGITMGNVLNNALQGYNSWQGDIAEVLVYDHQLSTNEMAQVSQYVGDKYGLFTPNSTWPSSYPTNVQALIQRNQWSKVQANNYVTQLASNPTLLATGLALWFKADSGVALSGTNVTGWTDPIRCESVTQSSTNNQPSYATNVINGYPTVRFNSVSKWLYSTEYATNYGNLNADMTMIVVGASTNTAASQYGMFLGVGGISSYGGQGRGLAYAGSTQLMEAAYDNVAGATVPAANTFNAEAWTLNATKTNVRFYRNGAQTASATIGGVGNLSLGITVGNVLNNALQGYNSWQGDIAEVLVYDHQLTTNELAQTSIYLATKYGIPGLVPAPVIAPNGGSNASSINLTISGYAAPTQIHYTTDGSTPISTSPLYTNSFTLTNSTQINAAIFLNGAIISPVATAQFYIADSQGIGISDSWQIQYFGQLISNPNTIGPNGLTYLQDYEWGYNPTLYSSNGDGLSDYENHLLGYAGNNFDINGDGLSNAQDIALGLNPFTSNPNFTTAPPPDPADLTVPVISLSQPTGATPAP